MGNTYSNYINVPTRSGLSQDPQNLIKVVFTDTSGKNNAVKVLVFSNDTTNGSIYLTASGSGTTSAQPYDIVQFITYTSVQSIVPNTYNLSGTVSNTYRLPKYTGLTIVFNVSTSDGTTFNFDTPVVTGTGVQVFGTFLNSNQLKIWSMCGGTTQDASYSCSASYVAKDSGGGVVLQKNLGTDQDGLSVNSIVDLPDNVTTVSFSTCESLFVPCSQRGITSNLDDQAIKAPSPPVYSRYIFSYEFVACDTCTIAMQVLPLGFTALDENAIDISYAPPPPPPPPPPSKKIGVTSHNCGVKPVYVGAYGGVKGWTSPSDAPKVSGNLLVLVLEPSEILFWGWGSDGSSYAYYDSNVDGTAAYGIYQSNQIGDAINIYTDGSKVKVGTCPSQQPPSQPPSEKPPLAKWWWDSIVAWWNNVVVTWFKKIGTGPEWAVMAIVVMLVLIVVFKLLFSKKTARGAWTALLMLLIVVVAAITTFFFILPKSVSGGTDFGVHLYNYDPLLDYVNITMPDGPTVQLNTGESEFGLSIKASQKITAVGYHFDKGIKMYKYDMSTVFTNITSPNLYFTIGGVQSAETYIPIQIVNLRGMPVPLYTSDMDGNVLWFTLVSISDDQPRYVFVGQSFYPTANATSGVIIPNKTVQKLTIELDGSLSLTSSITAGSLEFINNANNGGNLQFKDPWVVKAGWITASPLAEGATSLSTGVFTTQEWRIADVNGKQLSEIYAVTSKDIADKNPVILEPLAS